MFVARESSEANQNQTSAMRASHLVTRLRGLRGLASAGQRAVSCAWSQAAQRNERTFFSVGGGDGGSDRIPPNFIRNAHRVNLPANTVVKIVPQQEAWVIERFGKFSRILDSGIHLLIPVVDSIRYVHNLKEQTLDIPNQNAITRDNVAVTIDGILYVRVVDPYKASYGVEDPLYAVQMLAQTTMRSEIGKISLDKTFEERDSLNVKIVRR